MPEIQVNESYELYQIITDFSNPLEIFREAFQNAFDEGADKIFCHVYEVNTLSKSQLYIDIWNNGEGLHRDNVQCFFDLANSSKIDKNKIPIKGKLGYKGHGSKIFFNAERVEIFSKTVDDYWTASLINPIEQIENDKGRVEYSDLTTVTSEENMPENWKNGFFVRIINHLHFKTEHTKFLLNHMNLRDYCMWFTVVGSVLFEFDKELREKDTKLFLHGFDVEGFKTKYNSLESIDPIPSFETFEGITYEVINFGHYFPPERKNDAEMKSYLKTINSNKPYYEYYSRKFTGEETCSNNSSLRFIISIEGYETKRCYDALLTRRGKARQPISHTDSERYGLWACKGGVPIERIDDWIEEGKGQYTYLQAFVDYDDFKLTANRGSIRNTDIEKLEIIKKKINEIFSKKEIKDAMNLRKEFEEFENQLKSIEEDENNLRVRFNNAKKKKKIELPNGRVLLEPFKRKVGYNESETFGLLIQLMEIYPDLFNFKILDYDTTKGIDCVVEEKMAPKYIELKGLMNKKINHPFRHIYKFICYEINFKEGETISDIEDFKTVLKINKNDKFASVNPEFQGKGYTSLQLVPDSATIQSIEILELKSLLQQVIGAKIER